MSVNRNVTVPKGRRCPAPNGDAEELVIAFFYADAIACSNVMERPCSKAVANSVSLRADGKAQCHSQMLKH